MISGEALGLKQNKIPNLENRKFQFENAIIF